MNYEDLTKRLEQAKVNGRSRSIVPEWWQGYVAALQDIRNDFNTGEKT